MRWWTQWVQSRLGVAVLIAMFVALGLWYAFTTPQFEAPDEYLHYAVVDHLARGGGLPDQRTLGPWWQEGSQPPLFYLLAARVAALFPYPPQLLTDAVANNAHARLGDPSEPWLRNRNAVIHPVPPAPLDNLRLAVYAVRILNVGLGALAVWGVYQAARTLLTPQQAWYAAALAAFNPQFAFIAGAVNNDMLSAALGSLIIWQALRMLETGFDTRRSVTLGVLVALASLSKVSGLLFGVLMAGTAGVMLYRRRDWRGFGVLAAAGVMGWGVLAGWRYGRNLLLYGEITGTAQMVSVVGSRTAPPLGELLGEIQSLTDSFFGVFGWFNIIAGDWYYRTVDVVLAVALVSVLLRTARGTPPLRTGASAFVAITAVGGLLALLLWTVQTHGSQGRLLFPYLAAWNILLVLGLSAIPRALPAFAGGLLACAVLFPPLLIAPHYALDAAIERVPSTALIAPIRWDEVVELVGIEPLADTSGTGDLLEVRLYWRALRTTRRPFSLYLHLLTDDEARLGQIDSYPAGGMLSTTRWQAGHIYPDRHLLPVRGQAAAGTPLTLEIGWYRAWNGQRMTPYDSSGTPLTQVRVPAGTAR